MRIVVLGGTGMLGHQVVRRLVNEGDLWVTVRDSRPLRALADILQEQKIIEGVDAEDAGSLARVVDRIQPDLVVNCIGLVKQRAEAARPVLSIAVNSLVPHSLADACSRHGTRLIHISTDCVFSGRKGMYRESDSPDAEDLYGRSKLLGEVTSNGHLTIRTSLIGWELSRSTGLLEWLASRRNGKAAGYRRSVFSGLTTGTCAELIAALLENPSVHGLYHVSADPIDKYSLLKEVAEALRWNLEVVPVDEPVIDRSLDSTAFRSITGWRPPTWHTMIEAVASERPLYERWRTA
jgi:dTDP-4-dehydrorhamnose reductase